MNLTLNKRTALWAAVLMLIFALGAPSAALAQGKGRGQGRGRGQDKKAEKFKNGHDARDGRWDGRGPRSDRDDRYDDDDDDRYDNDDYRYRRNRRSNDGGSYDRTEVRRQAQSIGYQEGYRAGQDDRASGRGYDLESRGTYRDATAGYNNSYGDIEYYRSNFREAYRQGYEDGYRNRSGRGTRSRVGTILGDILGRP